MYRKIHSHANSIRVMMILRIKSTQTQTERSTVPASDPSVQISAHPMLCLGRLISSRCAGVLQAFHS